MNGVHRFLSRREKKPKVNGESSTAPVAKDVHRVLHTPADEKEKRKPDKDGDKKIKEITQRLQAEEIIPKEGQVEDVLRLPSVNGNVEGALSLLRLFYDAQEGKILPPNPQKKLAGAVNRSNVTCYLDSLLFSMFSRTDSFEGIISADFPDEPRKKLATLLRLWVNMLRTGKLITTDITQKLQESLKECGWPEAALLRQQDVSEAFTFITGKLDLPLLTLKMDVYHTGKEDRDDHRIVRERLLDVAIPKPPEDGSIIRLEDCLESYFNNKIEVKRHLQRRNTVQSFRPGEKEMMSVQQLEVGPETPTAEEGTVDFQKKRPIEWRKRGESIFGQRQEESGEKKNVSIDDIGVRSNRNRAGTSRREVLMPAWQFFSLIPWYTHDHLKDHPTNDEEVVVHLGRKKPVLGICLKRYSMTNAGVGSRLDTFIDIPLEIGVPHFISDDCGHGDEGYEPNFTNFKLSLLAVICHRGKSLDAGHYIALVRGKEDSHGHATEWLRFDDLAHERIISIDIQKALKDECPYLLFYQVRPIDDDDDESDIRGDPPTYDEAVTDGSNGELSRVPTHTHLNDQSTASSTIASEVSHETLVSTAPSAPTTVSTEPPAATAAVIEVTSTELSPVVSDPEVHTHTMDPPSIDNRQAKANGDARSKSIDLNGLAPMPQTAPSRASLEVPRGRASYQGTRSSTNAGEVENSSAKGGSSAPVTPADDNRASWMASSRRNSMTKSWLKPKSRPPSQSGEGRLSLNMSRLRSAMSRDKLVTQELRTKDDTAITTFAVEDSPEKDKLKGAKTEIPRRSKSLRHSKAKRRTSIGKLLDKGDGENANGKKVPDRECIVM